MGARIFKIIIFIIGGVVLVVLGLALTLWIQSPGTAEPITDAQWENNRRQYFCS